MAFDVDRRSLTELEVVVMAVGTAVACRWPVSLSLWASAASAVAALLVGRPRVVLVAIVALAAARGAVVAEGHTDLEPTSWFGEVRLVTDPEESRFGWVAEGRLNEGSAAGARVRLSFPWAVGQELAHATAGDVLEIEGRITAIDQNGWTRSRHLRGRLSATTATKVAGPRAWQAPSEWFRHVVEAGADGMPSRLRPLYLGLVIGDDRDQPRSQQAEFRAAGLSHLLAVSGQNVAFVLAVAAPALRRAGYRPRLALTVGLLVVFAVATRLEPSVVRATVSAGIAAVAVLTGRRSRGVRTLGLAVTGLLLIDPFLAQSIGFALSVLASGGILIAGPAISRRLRGPAWLADAAGITIAAQLFVAPLLIWVFGPISLVSLPANVLAGWAAGAVMTWGLTGGVVAGLLPAGLRSLVSLPASGLVWWIDAVAGWAVELPMPRVGMLGLVGWGLLVAGWNSVASNGRSRVMVRLVFAVAAVVSGWAAVPTPPRAGSLPLSAPGSEVLWWPSSTTNPSVLVVPANSPNDLVDVVVAVRITTIDIVIVERGNRTTSEVITDLDAVTTIGVVMAPPQHRIRDARRVLEPTVVVVGGDHLTLVPDDDKLEISVLDSGSR